MPRFYPMMMDLKGRNCVVVGGGEVAARKVEMLVKCGGVVKVIAPEIDSSLDPLIEDGNVTHVRGEYSPDHLKGAVIAIASTDNETVNRAVYRDATERGIPVNVVDVPDLCSFIVPSVVERGDLILAISTSGKSPAMAKRIRKEMESHFGPEYEEMIRIMGEIRSLLMKEEGDTRRRGEILGGIANSDLMDRLRAGERPSAEDVLREALAG